MSPTKPCNRLQPALGQLAHLAGVALIILASLKPMVRAQGPNRAGLVVDFGNGNVSTHCVEFSEPEISGYELLRRAGLNVVISGSGGMGIAVCDINNTSGCSAPTCFCKCQGMSCSYWSYHHLINGAWEYGRIGASGHTIRHGDVDGWGWGEGQMNTSGQQPPVIPFDQICAPSGEVQPSQTPIQVPPTDAPGVTATPLPSTDTPVPTATSRSTVVPRPQVRLRLDDNPIAAGACTVLRWDTSDTSGITLDGEPVDPVGSRQVCATSSTDYELGVVALSGEEEVHRVTLYVTGSASNTTPTSEPPETLVASTSPSNDATREPPSPTPLATGMPSQATPSEQGPSTPATRTPVEPADVSNTLTVTPAESGQGDTTPTSLPAAEASGEGTLQASDGDGASSGDVAQPPSLRLVGYTVFGLILGGLVAWLVYAQRCRGHRA